MNQARRTGPRKGKGYGEEQGLEDEDWYLACIGGGDPVAAAAAAEALLKTGKIQEVRSFNDMERKVRKLCSLCELKFDPMSLDNKVTRKRIVEWRREHGVVMKNVSPYTLYDYVPVCRFCAQFFGSCSPKHDKRKNKPSKPVRNEEYEGKVRALVFANEDRIAPSLGSYYFSPMFAPL